MKRAKNLFPILISHDNLAKAIDEVNKTHKFSHGRVNKTAIWVELTKENRINDIRNIIESGYVPKPTRHIRRYDHSACKWRDIQEPALWPDQYIHHAVVQACQQIFMRGMDYWCCGSIRGRGTARGIKGIKHWMEGDPKGTKYCAELDIRHFYDSLTHDVVMNRMRQLIKDKRMLNVIDHMTSNGIMIGAYYSQWMANVVLQPLDHMIREECKADHYLRYMDNLTLFHHNKKELHQTVKRIEKWLNEHDLELKANWQVYLCGFRQITEARRLNWSEDKRRRLKPRLPSALGYRFGRGYTLLRKHTLLRAKRKTRKAQKKTDEKQPLDHRQAAGMISRLGMLNHCNACDIRRRLAPKGTLRMLKVPVRAYSKWSQFQRTYKMLEAKEELKALIEQGEIPA